MSVTPPSKSALIEGSTYSEGPPPGSRDYFPPAAPPIPSPTIKTHVSPLPADNCRGLVFPGSHPLLVPHPPTHPTCRANICTRNLFPFLSVKGSPARPPPATLGRTPFFSRHLPSHRPALHHPSPPLPARTILHPPPGGFAHQVSALLPFGFSNLRPPITSVFLPSQRFAVFLSLIPVYGGGPPGQFLMTVQFCASHYAPFFPCSIPSFFSFSDEYP